MGPPKNENLAWKEEPTKAPTPDKLDRAAIQLRRKDEGRSKKTKKDEKNDKHIEEEASPNTPRSEQSHPEPHESIP